MGNMVEYQPVDQQQDVESHSSDDLQQVDCFNDKAGRRRTSNASRWAVIISVILATNLLSGLLGAWYQNFRVQTSDRTCAMRTSKYSPVLQQIDVKYQDTLFNGSFMNENIYRQKGNAATDKAWEDLGIDTRAGVISRDEGLKSGLTDAHVQVDDKYGGGFFVNVEGMHHLHCLNLVRKSLYYNIDYYKDLGTHAFVNEDHILQLHISHCLDIIRQTLMCQVDTGVLGQVWWNKDSPTAFPDFTTRHTCKNFQGVSDFAKKLQAPPPNELPSDYISPPKAGHVLGHMP